MCGDLVKQCFGRDHFLTLHPLGHGAILKKE